MALPILHVERPEDRRRLEGLLERLRAAAGATGQTAEAVASIIEQVRQRGDEALIQYMRKWTNPRFTADMIRVERWQLQAAAESMAPQLREAFSCAIENVRTYQRHIRPTDPAMIEVDDARLGLRFTPIERVGLHVPGGRASYPSSVVMLAVPAQVAGVGHLSVVTPPPTAVGDQPPGDVSPLVLGVCHMLGIERVYRLGGAQAIAALTYGTESVEPVDFIAGPGNAYTQQAKKQVFGTVGIDGFFGPSEIVVLADESANPAWIAADLIAQAEHDPGCCFLISTRRSVAEAVASQVASQVAGRRRREAIEKALAAWSAAVVVADDAAAYELVDTFAAEHVTLAVRDPAEALSRLRHGGAWFLGDGSPVASGDYYAGPSHCLPTSTTARYSSGLSVYTFMKRSSVEQYAARPPDHAIDHIAALAEAEGLEGHAASVRARKT